MQKIIVEDRERVLSSLKENICVNVDDFENLLFLVSVNRYKILKNEDEEIFDIDDVSIVKNNVKPKGRSKAIRKKVDVKEDIEGRYISLFEKNIRDDTKKRQETKNIRTKESKNVDDNLYQRYKDVISYIRSLSTKSQESLMNIYREVCYDTISYIFYTKKYEGDGETAILDTNKCIIGYDLGMFDKEREILSKKEKFSTTKVEIDEGIHQCRNVKCKSRKCRRIFLQTRSGDEGMTVFIICTECGSKHKG
jgi:DNA-directed RNA polymerase subunit M/transcription elongation factor TFIIS